MFLLGQLTEETGLDPISHPETLLEVDDPELGTYQDYLIRTSLERIQDYIRSLEQRHSILFAKAYMREMYEQVDDVCGRVTCAAYKRLSDSKRVGLDNPRYTEAWLFSLANGKGETYAGYFSRLLVSGEFDFDLERLTELSQQYADNVNQCRANGFSEIYAHTFAEQVNCGIKERFAAVHARCYEKKVLVGLTHEEAWEYATAYTDELEAYWPTGFEDPAQIPLILERTEERLRTGA